MSKNFLLKIVALPNFLLLPKKKSPQVYRQAVIVGKRWLNVGTIKSLRQSKPVSANPPSNKGFLSIIRVPRMIRARLPPPVDSF